MRYTDKTHALRDSIRSTLQEQYQLVDAMNEVMSLLLRREYDSDMNGVEYLSGMINKTLLYIKELNALLQEME